MPFIKKKLFFFSYIFILLVFSTSLAFAQNYPVQVIPQLLPPYSLNLTDYYTGTREKLAVTLINRDLQKPVLQVRLRMSIESQDVIIRSRDNTFYPSINLEPGIPLRISLNDLAPYFSTNNLDFQGITRMQYQQGAKLPDGLYRFNFEAVEVITGKVVSQKSYAMAWLSLSDPPLINIPRKGETIAFREPQNIIFQWTPRHMSSPNSAFSTEYEFSLVEIWDNGVAPESAFLSAQPLYQTTTRATTLLYGPGEPPLLPGKRYGWRIRAKAQSGAEDYDLFRNQGYSEIYWFTQSPDCKVPLNIQVSITGSIPTISWNADVNKIDYVVEYREKDNFKAQWFSQKTTENRMSLYDVKAGKTYEYRVGASCQAGEYVYTDVQSFEIKKPTGKGTVNCGLEAKFDIANKTLIQTLNPGETILAGDFPVKLTEVRGNGLFSGKGYITIPFIGMLNIAVAFDRIKVNTDRQLIDGVIVTVNDVKEGQVVSADSVVAQVKALTGLIAQASDKIYNEIKTNIENGIIADNMIKTFTEIVNDPKNNFTEEQKKLWKEQVENGNAKEAYTKAVEQARDLFKSGEGDQIIKQSLTKNITETVNAGVGGSSFYETDGHYSTVYLVSLMLGMSDEQASELARATEDPDTDVHSEMEFELDQTWLYPDEQKETHALTGGFHGIEEFITAMKILYTPEQNVELIGKLLHRYGDTYAHTKLDNVKPEDLSSYNLAKNPTNEKIVIESWKGKGFNNISNLVEPWLSFFNYYTKKYGFSFLTNKEIQKQVFLGETLSQILRDIYLIKPIDNFKMYGNGFWTWDHNSTDKSYPDMIYIRPDWYLSYVKNLAWLLAKKYNLDINRFDLSTFNRMTSFATANKCSLKGIIDYEIAKKKGKLEFFIPVFYSKTNGIAVDYDALVRTDYYKEAVRSLSFTKKYIIAEGKNDITVNPEKNWDIKINFGSGFFRTLAFKVEYR